jgi:hypothetical protein
VPSMRNASSSRWLLLLASLAAMSGCAQLPGGTAYPPVQFDPRLAAERYLSPASAPDGVAQTRALRGVWAGMGTEGRTASAPPVVAASREEPVVHTSSIQVSALAPPEGPPVGAVSDPNKPRTLWDKQPWEVELDKTVRGICRGC